MSHRVTTKTQITDKEIAMSALKAKGWKFTERGDTLSIEGGPMTGATINLKTGDVDGDTDYHSRDQLGSLSQAYGKEKYLNECNRQGITVESETVNEEGDIVLLCAML